MNLLKTFYKKWRLVYKTKRYKDTSQ